MLLPLKHRAELLREEVLGMFELLSSFVRDVLVQLVAWFIYDQFFKK